VIARNQEDGSVWGGLVGEGPGKTLPEGRQRIGVVKQIAGAQDGVDAVPARDVKNSGDHLHARPRQLLLRFLRKRGEAASEMPVGRVQEPQHDVIASGGSI
jgi:hypothetical protein